MHFASNLSPPNVFCVRRAFRYRLSVQRPVVLAGGIVRGLCILRAEGSPAMGPIHFAGGHVVHGHGNAQHGAQGDEVGAHMAVHGHAVIGAPVGHDGVHILKRAFAGQTGHKPGGRPRGVGAFIQQVVHLVGQGGGVALGDLQHQSHTVHDVGPR